jgi:glucose-1-phosphate adenylyltransferase
MKTNAVILAGGEGSRLGVLTVKRTKPAVPFGGKYRIIDFTLSNCVNSGLYDVMIIAQYRPHSLIEHIGSGGPWDLNRELTGGVRMYTPYKARRPSDWFTGTADAIQQNFAFVKRTNPDLIIILSGDHIYNMDYRPMIACHLEHNADLTLATIRVPISEASRFGIIGLDDNGRVTSFIEKPANPPSNQANMGVYLFNRQVLDEALWNDHTNIKSSHDFGKDILPAMVASGMRVYSYAFDGYWVDVGTLSSYWQAHMDLLCHPPTLELNDRSWIIHTRTEERPPVSIHRGAQISDSMLADGCIIEAGAEIERSVLSPGVLVGAGAVIRESVILTDACISPGAVINRAIIDKRAFVGENAQVGEGSQDPEPLLAMLGKKCQVPNSMIVRAGATVGTDVIEPDYTGPVVERGEYIQTRRLPNEI